ncbi:MAG TPA: hypothetical protein VGO01_10600 [Bradyrhizobium sp.]|nr:hypothetical protein [Bradyrhizobium sp.]
MPVLRYFMVMGCCLLGLLFVADYLVPKEAVPAPVQAATASNGGSLASWRQSQEKHDKPQVAAVVYPDIASLPPTAERLQWERQMTYRKPDSLALQARAELPATAAEAIAAPPVKHAAKIPSRPRTVARADRHDRPNYAAAYPSAPVSQFGGYRQAQFDRPAGGFFNFRMF